MASVELIESFAQLCSSEARLYVVGEKSLLDAVDRCQNFAVAYGLVADIGQDEVQFIMAEAFGTKPGLAPTPQLKRGDFDPFGDAS